MTIRCAYVLGVLFFCAVTGGCLISPDEALHLDLGPHDATIEGGETVEPPPDADAIKETATPDISQLDQASLDGQPAEVWARLVYGASGSGELIARTWKGQSVSWGTPEPIHDTDGVMWVVNRFTPGTSPEEVLAVLSAGATRTTLDLLRLDGSTWNVDWSASQSAAVENAGMQSFDMESESVSGDLLVVFADNSQTPVFRTRKAGSWSAETSLPLNAGTASQPDLNSGVVLWVELIARPGSDEMTLLYADDNHDLVALTWDGADWDPASAKILETELKTNPFSLLVNNRAFDGAYEAQSGDLLVAWGINDTLLVHASRQADSSSWSTPTSFSLVGGMLELVQLAGQPGTNTIAALCLDLGAGTERLGLAMWDGDQWIHAGEHDSQIIDVNDNAPGDVGGDVAWLGTTGTAVAIYPDEQSGTLDWFTGTESGGWIQQSPIPVNGKGFTESVQLLSIPGEDRVLAVVSDHKSQIFSLSFNGSLWTATNGGFPVGTISSVESRPFGVAFGAK